MAEKAPTLNFGIPSPLEQSKDKQVPTFNFAMPSPPEQSMPEAPALDFGSISLTGAFQSFREIRKTRERAKVLLFQTLDKLQPGESYPGYVVMLLIQGMFTNLSDQEIEEVLDDFLEKLKEHQEK